MPAIEPLMWLCDRGSEAEARRVVLWDCPSRGASSFRGVIGALEGGVAPAEGWDVPVC